MRVKDLIEHLRKFPEDTPVILKDSKVDEDGERNYYDLVKVEQIELLAKTHVLLD